MIQKNKRGDLPITILVIGIFIVFVLTISSLTIADVKFKSGFYGMNAADNVNSKVEQFYTYRKLGYSVEDSVSFIEGMSYDIENNEVVIVVNEFLPEKNTGPAVRIERKFAP